MLPADIRKYGSKGAANKAFCGAWKIDPNFPISAALTALCSA
jgi:hypothetical protein